MIKRHIEQHIAVFQNLSRLESNIELAAVVISDSLRAGNKLWLCGNGGSASDSQHIAGELAGRFIKDRRPLSAIALSTDTSVLTCIGNDYGFSEIFSRQVEAHAIAGDVLLVFSTSGNSENVLRAAKTAREKGVKVVGLTGKEGGLLVGLTDLSVIVPSADTARIQEAHIFIGHVLCSMIEQALGLGD